MVRRRLVAFRESALIVKLKGPVFMNDYQNFPVPFVLIKNNYALLDSEILQQENKLGILNNNGRRVLATTMREDLGEELIDNPLWSAPKILPTGDGGIEVGTFTEFARQDRHKHVKGTEIYTVLKGTLEIFINDEGPCILHELDEVVILPNTVHEIVQQYTGVRKNNKNFDLVVRVHAINCFGSFDKYVQLEPNGRWGVWQDLSKEKRISAYKKQIA
jgi:hypothetical protein